MAAAPLVPVAAAEARLQLLRRRLVPVPVAGRTTPCLLPATEVAGRVLRNLVMTVEQQAAAFCTPHLARVLRVPLPYDSNNPRFLAYTLDPMPPAGNGVVMADMWEKLRNAASANPPARVPFVLQTGVSGVGKTKAAYDVGLRHAYMVMSRVVQYDRLTLPWEAFYGFAAEVVRTSAHGADGLPPLVERVALKAALVVLLGAHLEWIVEVSEAADADEHREAFRAAAEGQLAVDRAGAAPAGETRRTIVLRELVQRAQRTSWAYSHVAHMFRRTLLAMLDARGAVADDGTLRLTVGAATTYLNAVVQRAHRVWRNVDGSAPVIMWAHDGVHCLLDSYRFPRDLFMGTHAGAGVVEEGLPPSPHAGGRYGWFHGLLAAIHEIDATAPSGHLLMGSSVHLAGEVLATYSPAHGRATVSQHAVHLTATDIRAWFAQYLTPAAMDGITDDDLAPLVGRPLFASKFWEEILARCTWGSAGGAAVDMVRDAVAATVRKEQVAATARMEQLWRWTTPITHGYVPSHLLCTLFVDSVMSVGSRVTLAGTRDEAIVCYHHGILNMRDGDTDIRLADEPITAAALRELGVLHHLHTGYRTDAIMPLLVERNTTRSRSGAVTGCGPAYEACLAWALLLTCLVAAADGRKWVLLRSLLEPYLALSATTRIESYFGLNTGMHPALDALGSEWQVCLTEGRRGDVDARRSPLSLLAAHPTALIHHPSTDTEGPGLMFLARHIDTGVTVPVLLRFTNCATAEGLVGALATLDLGRVHPDDNGAEVSAHADMRATLAAHPRWGLPFRVVAAARPFYSAVLHDVAWLNRTVLHDYSRLVLLHLTAANLRMDGLSPILRGVVMHDATQPHVKNCDWPACALPSPVRWWDDGTPLPTLAATPDLCTASLRVRFSSATATQNELVAAVKRGAYRVGGERDHAVPFTRHFLQRAVTATFTHAAPAITTLLDCRHGRLTAGGAPVTAAFVYPRRPGGFTCC